MNNALQKDYDVDGGGNGDGGDGGMNAPNRNGIRAEIYSKQPKPHWPFCVALAHNDL